VRPSESASRAPSTFSHGSGRVCSIQSSRRHCKRFNPP
jgi:hypothetical protein